MKDVTRDDDAVDPARIKIHQPDGSPYVVTPEGSLALLALGYKGLMAWRAERRDAASTGHENETDNG